MKKIYAAAALLVFLVVGIVAARTWSHATTIGNLNECRRDLVEATTVADQCVKTAEAVNKTNEKCNAHLAQCLSNGAQCVQLLVGPIDAGK